MCSLFFSSKILFILAEDPSEEFVALRDLVSFELAQKLLPEYFAKEAMDKTDRLTKEMLERARQICKLDEGNSLLFLGVQD